MKFQIERRIDPETGHEILTFSGVINQRDMERLELGKLDLALLAEMDRSGLPAADYLLALEMLYRRNSELSPNT
ncbi:hypothetical protein V5738_10975 [Salinisphaera sp. SPP-AMP-43]|uniref:hypothetical protein n=1 Tax=Salinisphaera sp. SPP-AMP-43 TaxID=3121288 RepID=UPI003C6DD688